MSAKNHYKKYDGSTGDYEGWFRFAESYAREYHAKEMEKVLDVPMHVIDKGCRENSREDFFKYGSNAKFIKGAKWLLNHLKQKQ